MALPDRNPPRTSEIRVATLGVPDLERAVRFYTKAIGYVERGASAHRCAFPGRCSGRSRRSVAKAPTVNSSSSSAGAEPA